MPDFESTIRELNTEICDLKETIQLLYQELDTLQCENLELIQKLENLGQGVVK